MDGKAHWVDNMIIKRFFRSLKFDNIYFIEYKSLRELLRRISEYIDKYSNVRQHAGLDYTRSRDEYFAAFSRVPDGGIGNSAPGVYCFSGIPKNAKRVLLHSPADFGFTDIIRSNRTPSLHYHDYVLTYLHY
jgi:putative transposase